MQVFNSINARKLMKTDLNVFEGIFDNSLYLIIQTIIVVGQIILVSVGGRAVRTQPLSLNQHLACIAISSLTLVISFIVKLMPFEDEAPSTLDKKDAVALLVGGYSQGGSRVKTKTRTRSTIQPSGKQN
jgi:hypothetical protein